MPTAEARPCPSGPVVISTPSVTKFSGWPGVFEPKVRRAWRSSSSRPKPARNSWVYWVRLECPADSTKRSRPSQVGAAGPGRITSWYSREAAGRWEERRVGRESRRGDGEAAKGHNQEDYRVGSALAR